MDNNKIASELVAVAKELVAGRVPTIATVKSILRNMGILDKVEVSRNEVEFWPENFVGMGGDEYRKAEKFAKDFMKRLGGGTLKGNGSYFRVQWRGVTLDMGDFNDRGSRWHY